MSQTTRITNTNNAADPVNPLVPDEPTDPMTNLIDGEGDQWAETWAAVEAEFMQQAGNPASEDPAAPTDPVAPGVDPAPTPTPATPVDDEHAPSPATVDGGGVAPAGPSAQSAEPPTPVAPTDDGTTPTPVLPVTQPSTLPDALNIDGLTIPRDQAEQQLRWLNSLTPEQRAAIDAALTPAQIAAQQQFTTPTPPTPATPQFDPASLAILDEAVPGFSQAFAAQLQTTQALRDELAQTRAVIDAQAAQSTQQTQAQTFTRITQARDAWAADHPEFAPSDVETLLAEAAAKVNYPSLVQQHGGDHFTATRDALDIAMRTNPLTHEAWMKAEFAKMQSTQANIDQKLGRQAALSSSPASVSRDIPPVNAKTMTDQERNAAIAAELAASWDAPSS